MGYTNTGLTLIYKGGKNGNGRVVFPESVPLHLNGAIVLVIRWISNKTCHRDRKARLTAPCPFHKKL